MFEKVEELLSFFPINDINFESGSGDQYLNDLVKTVNDNYDAGNFQVTYFYCHLIFMSFVYYCVKRVYIIDEKRASDVYYSINSYNGRNADKPNIDTNNIYEFSKIPEKEIFKLFHAIGMDEDKIRQTSKYISSRDDFAHATGKGNIAIEQLEANVEEITEYMDYIQNVFVNSLALLLSRFCKQKIGYQYFEVFNDINMLIDENNLSKCDLKVMSQVSWNSISQLADFKDIDIKQFRYVKYVFEEFCAENYGYAYSQLYKLHNKDEDYLFFKYKNNANDFVENELKISKYECVKDGGIFPLFKCAWCGEEQLVFLEDKNKYHCFSCDEEFDSTELQKCDECGELFLSKEDEIICSDCWKEKLEKD